ncbi:hypothetical protein [Streptomyces sp. NPDC091212]|uniref:hypothetical protein n=1 Tax=Streptomyces sp. NPDC091212 TaxID=3155191 RepID=UPI0034391817
MTIIMTGPQSTADEREDLAELAGLYGALLACDPGVNWASATGAYCAHGWEVCPLAVADVAIAGALGIDVRYLSE